MHPPTMPIKMGCNKANLGAILLKSRIRLLLGLIFLSTEYSLALTERWPSGRWRTPGKCVYGNVSRVRIPLSPQNTTVFYIPTHIMMIYPLQMSFNF